MQRAEPDITIHCKTCGSENVLRDAWAVWNVELQQWELDQIFDHAICDDCGGETKLIENLTVPYQSAETEQMQDNAGPEACDATRTPVSLGERAV